MLSTAQDYRPGVFGEQIPRVAGDARRARDRVHDAPEERTAARHALARRRRLLDRHRLDAAFAHSTAPSRSHIYAPQFAPSGSAARAFGYLDYTHAYFPTEHFDEVVQDGQLDVRPPRRRLRRAVVAAAHRTGATTTTRGVHARPRRSRSTSSPAAVPTTCGSRRSATDRRSRSFDEFRAAVGDAAVARGRRRHRTFDVTDRRRDDVRLDRRRSPSPEPPIELHPDARMENPFVTVPFEGRRYEIGCDGSELVLDFEEWTRTVPRWSAS